MTLQTSGRRQHDAELRRAIISAVGALPREAFVPLVRFCHWQAQECNPLVELLTGPGRPSLRLNWSGRPATIEELEAFWSDSVLAFVRERLVPLGGMRLGLFGDTDKPCIALADPGRYLLGLIDDFDYGHAADAQGRMIVQPNFEVVFLAPSPLAEAALGRFADRKSAGAGALFAITKKSIVAAAGCGMTAPQVLDTLGQLSSKPVPANVAREITGWFGQCRRVHVRLAVLIRCPDADTAARVVAAGGKHAALLTETVVELTSPSAKTELLRKLHGQGIFTDNSAPARRSPRGAGRRRSRR